MVTISGLGGGGMRSTDCHSSYCSFLYDSVRQTKLYIYVDVEEEKITKKKKKQTDVWHSELRIVEVRIRQRDLRSSTFIIFVVAVIVVSVFVRSVVVAERPIVVCRQQQKAYHSQ